MSIIVGRRTFDRLTLRHGRYGGIDVVGWSTHGKGSVLEGQPMKCFLDNFKTEEEARAAHPEAQEFSNVWAEPKVSLNHLPGENDPVPGGMYLDDIPE